MDHVPVKRNQQIGHTVGEHPELTTSSILTVFSNFFYIVFSRMKLCQLLHHFDFKCSISHIHVWNFPVEDVLVLACSISLFKMILSLYKMDTQFRKKKKIKLIR